MVDYSDFPIGKPESRPKKKKGLNRVNPVRKEREFARAYHSEARVEFVKALPCLVGGCLRRPSDNAHIVGGGGSRKADYDKIVPACRPHHRQLDEHPDGREGFEGEHLVDLKAMAAHTEQLWQEHERLLKEQGA